MNSFEGDPSQIALKEKFIQALDTELADLKSSGRITAEQANEKRESALLIEKGFSDDPGHDALVFSRAGIAEEKEMTEIFNSKKSV